MMKLWLLERSREGRERDRVYDCANGFVIRAETEEDARIVASERPNHGDEGPDCWLDVNRSDATELSVEGSPGVILQDFHHG